MISGIVGILTLPFVVFLSIMEPSNEYPEPLHTITHDGPAIFFPAGLLLGIIAVVLGIMLLARQGQSRTTQALARVGLVTGAIAIFLTALPAIGVVVTLLTR
jgi:hypothetical protein